MQSAKLDLVIQKGTTFRQIFILRQSDGTPVDLTGSSIRAMLRKSYTSSVKKDFTASVLDPPNGRCEITLTAIETAAIGFSVGVYDVEIIFANGEVAKPLFGNVLIKKEATYD